jgi:Na+/melibiose symporter-like transporter
MSWIVQMASKANRNRDAGAPLTSAQLLAFGFPALTHAMVASPVYGILPTYYAANTMVTLAQIGTIAAFSRIIDALNDPIMGYLSDRTRTRFGGRKPYIVAAILLMAIAVFQLFSPPADAGWLYFLLWSQVLYTGFTMFEVPRSAWSSEVSRDYNQRARIGVYVGGFNIAGSLLFYSIPIIMGIFTGNSAIDGNTLHSITLIYIIFMPLGILISVWLVPSGEQVAHRQVNLRDVFRSILRSRPAQIFFSASVLWGLGQGVVVGCSFLFYTEYMELPGQYAVIMMVFFSTEILSLPIWSRLLPKFDRHRVWAFSVCSVALVAPFILLVPVGPDSLLLVLAFATVRGFLSAPTNFLPAAILGDVIDHDILRSGSNKAGNLFAVQMVLIKISMAVGGAIAFNVLDILGYEVGSDNGAAAKEGLLVTYFAVPALLHIGMAFVAWRFPIGRRQQKIIQARISQRGSRAAAGSELD